MTGFVYFLRCGDFVKIGYSAFPNIRINHLRTATPYQVELIGKLAGTMAHEKALHRYFADVRHSRRQEWFRLTDGIRDIAVNGYPTDLGLSVAAASFDWELVDATAEKAGVPYFTRRKWRKRKRVPVHWWPALEEASGGVLTVADFQKLVPAAGTPPEQSESAA